MPRTLALSAVASAVLLAAACHGRTTVPPAPSAVAVAPGVPAPRVVARASVSGSASAPASHPGVPGFEALNVPIDQMTARARSSGRPAILYFCAGWCGFCRKMNRETLSDPAVQRRIHDFPASVYDPDTPDGRAVARRFGIDAYPTMVLVDGSGREVDQVIGARPAPELLSQLGRW